MSDTADKRGWLPRSLARKTEWRPAQGERPEGKYVTIGGRVGQTVATLRLFGKDLDPDEITRPLGCEPTETHRIGDPVTKSGRGARKDNSWRLTSRLPETEGIDAHVGELLASVTQDLDVRKSLARFAPDIFVGVFLTGFNQCDTVSPMTSALLAERGIELSLDIYSEVDDEE